MAEWHQLVGFVGMGLIVGSYLLLQVGKLNSMGLPFSIFNALGALALVVSLIYRFNLPAMIVELFWLLISLIGIGRYLRAGRRRG